MRSSAGSVSAVLLLLCFVAGVPLVRAGDETSSKLPSPITGYQFALGWGGGGYDGEPAFLLDLGAQLLVGSFGIGLGMGGYFPTVQHEALPGTPDDSVLPQPAPTRPDGFNWWGGVVEYYGPAWHRFQPSLSLLAGPVIARDETWYGEERRDRMLLLLPEARLFLVLSSRARIGLTLGGRITSGLDDRWQHPAEMDGFHLTLHLRGGHFSRSERTDGPH